MNVDAIAGQYKKKEGWLEKKSPSFPFGFQKRFFSICDDSNVLYLLYDKNQPTKDKKPKGAINISLIPEIITKDTSREFSFKFSGRDFVLRAPTLQDKLQWIETIKFLREYAIESKEGGTEDNTANKNIGTGKAGWKFERLDPTLQRNLRINIEKKNQGEDLTKEIEVKDEQMQKSKGIFPYFEKYSEEAMLNHVVQGFLYKKKERFTNKVVQPKQRWFFMFTDFSLADNARHDLSDFDLDDLPPFVNPNVLYYYNMGLDESPCEGNIHVKNMVSIKKLDLKVEGDNILKKGIDGIGNSMITVMNKFTEITMLDKIGAHIHRFEFQFQLVTNKDGKEVTHNFYSASLLQIEKWVKSITKVIQLYKAREAEKEAVKISQGKEQQGGIGITGNSSSVVNSGDLAQQPVQQQQQTSPNQGQSVDSDDERLPNGSPQNQGIQDAGGSTTATTQSSQQSSSPPQKRRDQIIMQVSLKIQAWSKLLKTWGDRIVVLRRQILSIYKDEKDLTNMEVESYITLKDINQVIAEKNKQKLKIIKKNKEEKRFRFKDQQTRDQWVNAINLLIADSDTPIEKLQVIISENNLNPIGSQKSRDSAVLTPIDEDTDNKKGSSINGESYQPQGKSSNKSNFSSVDNFMFRAYSNSFNSREASSSANSSDIKKSGSLFSSLFGCCVGQRGQQQNNQSEDDSGEEGQQIVNSKRKLLAS